MAEAQPPGDIANGSVLMGSESDFDIACNPCGYDGNTVEAEGYCLDCCEYLCAGCYKYHRKPAMFRHHKLVGKDDMPTQPTGVKVKDICTERCQQHNEEIVKYFCPIHKELGCTVCVTIKHKTCDDMTYIPDVAGDIENSADYKAFLAELESLIRKSELSIQSASDNKKALAENYTKVLQDIEAYKQEMLNKFEDMANDIKSKLETLTRSAADSADTVSDTGTHVLEELQAISRDFETSLVKKQYCQMFTDMKHTEQKLADFKRQLDDLDDNYMNSFRFIAGEEVQALLRKQDAFGKITDQRSRKLEHLADINVKENTSHDKCNISGDAMLSKEKLVIVDYQNDTIKLVDTVTRKVVSELKCEGWPWDVTRVSDNQVAVTLENKNKLLLVKCDEALAIDREIIVDGKCRGVDCFQEKLYVTYETPAKVEIMSLTGEVLQIFETDGHGKELFVHPTHICVNPVNQSIYVSDRNNDCVIQLDMAGNVKSEYKDDQLKLPGKMAVDGSGMIYLCGGDSHNIHLLTPECRKVKILLEEKDGLSDPHSVCYCEATDRLYIGMVYQDIIKVYKNE